MNPPQMVQNLAGAPRYTKAAAVAGSTVCALGFILAGSLAVGLAPGVIIAFVIWRVGVFRAERIPGGAKNRIPHKIYRLSGWAEQAVNELPEEQQKSAERLIAEIQTSLAESDRLWAKKAHLADTSKYAPTQQTSDRIGKIDDQLDSLLDRAMWACLAIELISNGPMVPIDHTDEIDKLTERKAALSKAVDPEWTSDERVERYTNRRVLQQRMERWIADHRHIIVGLDVEADMMDLTKIAKVARGETDAQFEVTVERFAAVTEQVARLKARYALQRAIGTVEAAEELLDPHEKVEAGLADQRLEQPFQGAANEYGVRFSDGWRDRIVAGWSTCMETDPSNLEWAEVVVEDTLGFHSPVSAADLVTIPKIARSDVDIIGVWIATYHRTYEIEPPVLSILWADGSMIEWGGKEGLSTYGFSVSASGDYAIANRQLTRDGLREHHRMTRELAGVYFLDELPAQVRLPDNTQKRFVEEAQTACIERASNETQVADALEMLIALLASLIDAAKDGSWDETDDLLARRLSTSFVTMNSRAFLMTNRSLGRGPLKYSVGLIERALYPSPVKRLENLSYASDTATEVLAELEQGWQDERPAKVAL